MRQSQCLTVLLAVCLLVHARDCPIPYLYLQALAGIVIGWPEVQFLHYLLEDGVKKP